MRQVEIKLGEWHRLHGELGTVERELADALLHSAHEEHERLRARETVLRQQNELAFQDLLAAMRASKAARERRPRS